MRLVSEKTDQSLTKGTVALGAYCQRNREMFPPVYVSKQIQLDLSAFPPSTGSV